MKSLISKAKSEDAKVKSTLKLVKQDLGTTSRLYDTEVLSNRTIARVERTPSQRNKREVAQLLTVYYTILDSTTQYDCGASV